MSNSFVYTVLQKLLGLLPTNLVQLLLLAAEPTGQDRTSILFGVRDKVGSLADVLTVLRDHRLNMSKIESLPSQNKTWESVFFADFSGHQLDPQVSLALPSIREKSAFVKVLGSYPTDNRYIGT